MTLRESEWAVNIFLTADNAAESFSRRSRQASSLRRYQALGDGGNSGKGGVHRSFRCDQMMEQKKKCSSHESRGGNENRKVRLALYGLRTGRMCKIG